MAIASFRELKVWQKSFSLVINIYKLTALLAKREQFGLVSQINRCAVSIPSNIAEGQQRHGRKEYRQFLGIALGSAAELETQLLLTQEIYQLSAEPLLSELQQIQKMLYVLIKRLEPRT